MERYPETNINRDSTWPEWPSWPEAELRNGDLLRQEGEVRPLIVDVYEAVSRIIGRLRGIELPKKAKQPAQTKKSPRSGWIDAGS